MGTTFRILNWLALTFFGFAIVYLAVSQPASAVTGAANILPYGSALIASRQDTKPWFAWVAFALNIFWSVVLLGSVMVVLLGLGGSLVAIPFLLAFALPCIVNTFVLWKCAYAGLTNHSSGRRTGAA